MSSRKSRRKVALRKRSSGLAPSKLLRGLSFSESEDSIGDSESDQLSEQPTQYEGNSDRQMPSLITWVLASLIFGASLGVYMSKHSESFSMNAKSSNISNFLKETIDSLKGSTFTSAAVDNLEMESKESTSSSEVVGVDKEPSESHSYVLTRKYQKAEGEEVKAVEKVSKVEQVSKVQQLSKVERVSNREQKTNLNSAKIKPGYRELTIENIHISEVGKQVRVRFSVRNLKSSRQKGLVYGVAKYKRPDGSSYYRGFPKGLKIDAKGRALNRGGIAFDIRALVYKNLSFEKTTDSLLGIKIVAESKGGYLASLLMRPSL